LKSGLNTLDQHDQSDQAIINFLKKHTEKTIDDFQKNPISLLDILEEYNDQEN
jgi:hypothetical protein